MIPVGSIVTEKTIGEFEILKFSLESYHSIKWILSCDEISYEKYKNIDNCICLKLIKTDDCDHNIQIQSKKDNWMKVMMTKFDVCEYGIKKYGHILFLDSDMIFVNPIEDKILSLLEDNRLDAMICQHMSNDHANEAIHGVYNAGMFHVKNLKLLESWRELSSNYKELGFYFEQQPLEYVQRNFITVNLPINYNIGWWRFNNQKTKNRLELLSIKDEKIFFGNLPAVNFHVHTVKEIGYQNFGQFLVNKIYNLFKNADNKVYNNLSKLIEDKIV